MAHRKTSTKVYNLINIFKLYAEAWSAAIYARLNNSAEEKQIANARIISIYNQYFKAAFAVRSDVEFLEEDVESLTLSLKKSRNSSNSVPNRNISTKVTNLINIFKLYDDARRDQNSRSHDESDVTRIFDTRILPIHKQHLRAVREIEADVRSLEDEVESLQSSLKKSRLETSDYHKSRPGSIQQGIKNENWNFDLSGLQKQMSNLELQLQDAKNEFQLVRDEFNTLVEPQNNTLVKPQNNKPQYNTPVKSRIRRSSTTSRG